MFSNVCLKDPRLFISDHLLVLGVLLASPAHDQRRYLQSRRRFPLRPPQWGPQMHADTLFQSLTDAIPAPVPATKRAWQLWISNETWKMVDERSALRQHPNHDHTEAWCWIDGSNRHSGPTGNDEQPQQGRPSRPH
jgi:hypothetical protein